MASDINRVTLIGRLTLDPQLSYTPSGTAVCNFSVANGRSFTQGGEKKESVSFFSCIAWGKLGELIAEHCRKGHRIGLEGRLDQRRWKDSEGNSKSKIEIVVENLQFLQSKEHGIGEEVDLPDEENPFSDDKIPY